MTKIATSTPSETRLQSYRGELKRLFSQHDGRDGARRVGAYIVPRLLAGASVSGWTAFAGGAALAAANLLGLPAENRLETVWGLSALFGAAMTAWQMPRDGYRQRRECLQLRRMAGLGEAGLDDGATGVPTAADYAAYREWCARNPAPL